MGWANSRELAHMELFRQIVILQRMTSYKKTTLKNGLRIIAIPQENSVAMTVLTLVETGSKYETKEINGISHFLEHLCFKGTKQRPEPSMIASELDGLGAQSNAFTGQEYTGYYAKVSADKGKKALEIIADLYLNPIFKSDEIEKEKGVIIEEIHMYEDMPQRRIGDYFMSLLYGDQPAGWDIAGSPELIRAMTREQIVQYRGAHYVPSATVLVVAGAFNEAEVIKNAEQLFGQMSAGTKHPKLAVIEKQSAPALFLKFKKSDQAHIMLGVRAFPMNDPRRYVIEVMGDLLGGGMSSRLFQLLRERLGAAYYVRASADLFTDHGYFAANAGIELSKVTLVISEMLKEFARLKNEVVSEAELNRAKSHLVGNLLLGLETSDSLAVFYGGQEILKRSIEMPEDILKGVQAVTAEQIQKLAQELFTPNMLNLAIIGPFNDEGEFKKLLIM